MASVKEQIESLARQNRRTREEIEAIERGKDTKATADRAAAGADWWDKTAFRQQVEQQTTSLRQSEKDILVQRKNTPASCCGWRTKKRRCRKNMTLLSLKWDEYETTRSQAESIAQPAEDVNQANRALGEVKGKSVRWVPSTWKRLKNTNRCPSDTSL